jgi:hypothetical protein
MGDHEGRTPLRFLKGDRADDALLQPDIKFSRLKAHSAYRPTGDSAGTRHLVQDRTGQMQGLPRLQRIGPVKALVTMGTIGGIVRPEKPVPRIADVPGDFAP